MATVFDVAAYILQKCGPLTAMKLQKLCYYSQAWHLVWDEQPLFQEDIEAWANGPVVPELYRVHRGQFRVGDPTEVGGDATALTAEEVATIDSVLGFYGDKSAHWLSELTHREAPWRDARAAAGLADQERGRVVIEHSAMFEYYDSLTASTS
jgi:uncharacterized phage-associated protein